MPVSAPSSAHVRICFRSRPGAWRPPWRRSGATWLFATPSPTGCSRPIRCRTTPASPTNGASTTPARRSTSNWGPQTIQLAAPGTDIYSTNQVGTYSFGSGTSFSTPFVSGVAALLLSLQPDLDVVALKHALVGTYAQESDAYTGCPCGYRGGGAVDQLAAFSGLLSTGGGRLDACTAIPGCGGDFTLATSPASQSVTAGGGTSYTVTINPIGGFTGSVSLSASGLPSGVSASFNPNPATSSSTLAVTTSASTPPGSYPLTITGVNGNRSHTTTVTLVVNAPSGPDFGLAASPASQTVVRGGSTTFTVTITPSGGFNGSVSLSVGGLPSGASGSFNPNPATSSSTLSVTTSASTPTGSRTVTVTGVSGSVTHSTTVSLMVKRK